MHIQPISGEPGVTFIKAGLTLFLYLHKLEASGKLGTWIMFCACLYYITQHKLLDCIYIAFFMFSKQMKRVQPVTCKMYSSVCVLNCRLLWFILCSTGEMD